MTTYQAVLNHNNAGNLADFSPQPASPGGVQTPRKVYAGSRAIYPDGDPFVDLVFTIADPSERNTLDAQLGLSDTVFSAEITVRVRKNDDTFANYNAVVERNDAQRNLLGWRNLTYRVYLLEAL